MDSNVAASNDLYLQVREAEDGQQCTGMVRTLLLKRYINTSNVAEVSKGVLPSPPRSHSFRVLLNQL